MPIHKVKDNSKLQKEELEDVESLIEKIENKTLDELEQEGIFVFPETINDSEDIQSNQMILQGINNNYYTTNIMGFIGYKNERIIIESRFSNGSEDYFSKYLLNKVLDFPNIVNLKFDTNQDTQLFSFLLFLFPHYLKIALRKGFFKQYKYQHYNDKNIKGVIDISRHIIKNTPFLGNIAYTQREFSYDNSLIELIRHTIEFIKRKSYGNRLLSRIKDEVRLIMNATPSYKVFDRQKIINENKKKPLRHAYFREYRDLQRLCLMILQYQRHNIGFGSQQIYGILFDGAWLWEEYINSLIKDIFYHPRNKGKKGAQRLFNRNVGLIYPDFISRNKTTRTIADAKYKPMRNIGNKDYHQLLAYMFRFDAKTGYYLYPEIGEAEDLRLWMNSGSTYEDNVIPRTDISLIKHGLKIPYNASSYDDFIEKIKLSEQKFREEFMKYVPL